MLLAESSFVANVRRGVRMGIAVAIGFSLIAGALSLAAGANGFESIHTSFWGGIAMYFVAGLCVGTVGGVLAPLMGSNIGLALVGALLGLLADFVAQATENGTGVLRHYDWFQAAVVAVVSIPIAFYTRARIRARARAKGSGMS